VWVARPWEGSSAGRGLLGEAAARLGQRLVPSAPDEWELASLVWRLFPGEEGAAWLDELSEQPVAALRALLGAPAFAPVGAAVEDAVVGTVTLVGLLLQALRGRPLLEVHEAEYVVRSLHPLRSGTLFFAALTGVLQRAFRGTPAPGVRAYTGTAKSRSAALRLVFLSVLSLRCPMMSAHGTM
jgi:site-specific recombinase